MYQIKFFKLLQSATFIMLLSLYNKMEVFMAVHNRKNLTGMKFGTLTAVIANGKNKMGRSLWLCKCDCGKEISTTTGALMSGNTKSCGCVRKKREYPDLSGSKFNMLTVIKKSEYSRVIGSYAWNCICDCGKEIVVMTSELNSGHVQSCGCLQKIKARQTVFDRRKDFGEITGTLISRIKSAAESRKLEFSVTIEYIWNLYLLQNKKCKLSGVDIIFGDRYDTTTTTASLDRIDSSKGYIDGNVQWVHKAVNYMKWDKSDEEFLMWCNLITDWNKNIPGIIPT